MAAAAPAAAAFATFSPKVQVPRWITAMPPLGKPAKSAAEQPLVLLGVGVGEMIPSAATSGPVTSPAADNTSVK